jgi:Na+/proline symporter
MVIVNIFFLSLGVLLYNYYEFAQVPLPTNTETGKVITDQVFPNLALNHLGVFSGLVFILGLTAATFSSADSVLTTLTTSAYIDVLEIDKRYTIPDEKKSKYRTLIHIGFTFLLWLIILLFKQLNKSALVDTILIVAGYTYGPLLALFFIGLFSKINLKDKYVPVACLIGPVVCYLISSNSKLFFGDYQIGMELIILNALICSFFLLLIRKKDHVVI